jgi:release factor glutamine methyltransferase
MGLTLQVSPAVLIPRPETEELVQWILDEYHNRPDGFSIADLCTGSGCIAIALKNKLRRCDVYAVDISTEALEVAKTNAENCSVDVHFIQADLLHDTAPIPNCLIMVSNPPYVKQSEKTVMHNNIVEHEPHLALFVPDEDALVFYRAIGQLALQKLKVGGCLYVEINETLGLETCTLFQQLGFGDVLLKQDMQGKDRMIAARK